MRTIALPESVLRTQSLPSCPPKPLRLFNFCLFSKDSLPKMQNSKFSRRIPSSLSRYSRRSFEEWCGHSHGIAPTSSLGMQEFGFLNCESCRATREMMHDLDDNNASKKLLAKYKSGRGHHIATDVPVSETSYGSLLKFMLLFGLFTLDGSQQAVAGSDFASGFQSIPYLADLGDISTGFASVRKISF